MPKERWRNEEKRLRLLETAIEHSFDAVTITDAELDEPGPRILYVNPAFTAITGYSKEEVVGKTPRILQGPETDRRELDRLRKAMRGGKTFVGEVINYRKDGTTFFLEWRINPVRDPSGAICNWVAVQRDISKRVEDAVRHRELRNQLASLSRLIATGDATETEEHHQRRRSLQQQLDCLTPRERQVLDRLVAGQALKQVAKELGVSHQAIARHRARILEKMQVESEVGLVRLMISTGFR